MENTLRILGKTYKVKFVDKVDEEDSLGLCKAAEQEILLRIDQPQDCLRDTLLHEIVHALDYQLHLGLKERQVHCIAMGIVAVLLDNPEFAQSWNSMKHLDA